MNTTHYSENMQRLYAVYVESGIWRRWNWYDFLRELNRIIEIRK